MAGTFARIRAAYQVELSKALRQRITYLGPALVLLVILLALLIHPMRRDGISDYDFIAFATPLALNLLGFVLLLVFGASQVSSEMGSGTIRTVLVHPVLRHEYGLAKLLVIVTYALALTLAAAASAWLLVLLLGDMSGITYGGEVIYTDRDMRHTYLLGLGMNLLPQIAAAGFALMISTFTRSTGTAVAMALGLWIVSDIAKHPLNIAPYLFTSYTETSWMVFQERCDALSTATFPPAYYWLVATSLFTAVVCVVIALTVLRRRNFGG